MAFNPYATEVATVEETVPQYSMPRGSYAAPSLEAGDAYTDTFGWGPELRVSTVQTPSAQRLGAIPRFGDYPDPTKPPQTWYDRLDADDKRRDAVTTQNATGWGELKGVAPGDLRWADNPRRKPPAENRVTQQQSPANYSFTRPFDQFNRTYANGPASGSARHLNGLHFSMADHRRTYEAVGTMPVRTGRNTYRMEPTPWDTDVVDLPSQSGPDTPSARIRSIEVPSSSAAYGTRSYRLM
jgi:hypothetical protein